MLFKLIWRSLLFNLYTDSLFEDVCDKDDCRYNYYLFSITYECHQCNLPKNQCMIWDE